MNVIPAIDLRAGRCVRLLQGDFDRSTEYSADPAAVARRFEALGTTDLHVVDLDGAQTGVQDNRDIVSRIAVATHLSVQVGGGVRDRTTLESWFDAGVSRCVVGSLAATDPDSVKAWLARFGSDRIVLALDVRIDRGDVPRITTHGWTRGSDTTVFEAIRDFRDAGIRHVLCTDVSRDGALTGPNVALYRRIMERFPDLELQASGGVRDVADLELLRDSGIPAAITGRALIEGRITAGEMRSFRRNA